MMSRDEKLGLGALILLFLLAFAILFYTVTPAGTNKGGAADSVIVQQRLKNLEKSR
jgi:hypothetical protein